MMRFTPALLVALLFAPSVQAQSAFDPEPVAYALCVTNQTKQRALIMPPIAKDAIVEQAFRACSEEEKQFRKSLTDKGVASGLAEQRLSQIQKFIRQTAPDDIDRFRANARPR